MINNLFDQALSTYDNYQVGNSVAVLTCGTSVEAIGIERWNAIRDIMSSIHPYPDMPHKLHLSLALDSFVSAYAFYVLTGNEEMPPVVECTMQQRMEIEDIIDHMRESMPA